MGRWAGCVYQVKKSQVAVFSIYQTVENTFHGQTSIHSQQVAILLKEKRKLTPRQALQIDLITTVRMLQAKQVEVIIAGDFNTADTSEGIIKALQLKCNLEIISNPQNVDDFLQKWETVYRSCYGKYNHCQQGDQRGI